LIFCFEIFFKGRDVVTYNMHSYKELVLSFFKDVDYISYHFKLFELRQDHC